jgi:predicted  nucleic acid-binding Zn-ribbon protein
MSNNEKFEQLKKKIDNLNVRKLASESEAKRLEEELEKSKKEIKDVYNVDIKDFANAIEVMKKEYQEKLAELEELVAEAI